MGHKASPSEIIEEDIPSFLLQIVLFLNAGLVLNAALEQFCISNSTSQKPLFAQICSLAEKAKSENLPLQNQIYLYARSIKSKELVRISLILMNHNLRGSSLAEKLEGEIAYFAREGSCNAKAKAKEAETKLCFPLVLLLLALIGICISPAMMNL